MGRALPKIGWALTGLAIVLYCQACGQSFNGGSQALSSSGDIVTPTPGAPGAIVPLFFSDWATSTIGVARADVNDDGKWDIMGGMGHEVVSAAGLDFPMNMANVYKVNCHDDNMGFNTPRTTQIPLLAVGSSRFYRWYVRMTFPDTLGGLMNGDHPWQDGSAVGGINWMVGVGYAPGQWIMSVFASGNPNPGNYHFVANQNLNKNQTYRIELAIHRMTSTTFTMDTRVYDSQNNLVLDNSDFENQADTVPPIATLADAGPHQFFNPANLNGLNMGVNDFFDGVPGQDAWFPYLLYGYQGGFAVADDQGWIGPYGSVIGEN